MQDSYTHEDVRSPKSSGSKTGLRQPTHRRSRSKSKQLIDSELHSRKQKEQKKVFDQLAGIYLQNPYYLRSNQFEEILRMKTAAKNEFRKQTNQFQFEQHRSKSRGQRYNELDERSVALTTGI